MAGRVSLVKDGYAIRGLLPPALRMAPDPVKLTFWSFVVAEGMKEKDRELARGLDAEGEPLKPIAPETRRHRRSAMTPTGRGDPSAPPLTPGRALSRTRSLLAGRAFPDRAEFWWRYDPYTYDSWAHVLREQRKKGRDVFGLSPAGLARVAARSWRAFGRHQGAKLALPPPPAVVQPAPAIAPAILPVVGTTSMKYATVGIGAVPHAPGARTTGGLPWEQWLAHLRKPAPPPAGMVPTRRPFNTLLDLIFGPTTRPAGPAKPPPPPPRPLPVPEGAVPFRKPRPLPVAAAPVPMPTPTPTPAPTPLAVAAPKSRAERAAVSREWRRALTVEERGAVGYYVGNGYLSINPHLREGIPPLGQTTADVERSVDRLDRALAKASLERSFRVWRGVRDVRGMGLDPDNLVGAEITDPGFLSTSFDRDRGLSFVRGERGGALLRIAAPKGSPGGFVGELANLETEQEVLFARGLTLRITGSSRDKAGVLVIDADLIHGR